MADKPKTPAPAPAQPRQRAAISKERQLALLLGAVVAFCDAQKFKGAPIEAARKVAQEVNDKVVKPIVDALGKARAELKGYNMETVAVEKMQETLREIKRLEARLATINAQATGEPAK